MLAYFDNRKETVLMVDTGSTGLGALIMQEGKPVAFSSKTLTPSETMYANIERELLAIVWGVQKFHTYVAWGLSPSWVGHAQFRRPMTRVTVTLVQ